MVAITRALSSLAERTRVRWPSCKAPMVGTRPTLAPPRRYCATCARRSVTVRTISNCPMMDAGARQLNSSARFLEAAEHVVRPREAAGAHVGGVVRGGRGDVVGQLGIAFHEARLEGAEQAQHVFRHQHLPIAIG